ncbi:hypothetical protein [Adhaeribacter terreus]|uniref:hypothetical protein n=1 Tax=Adhaeribacter terreus TaxID=529703 RepID=UPI00366EC256
MKVAAALKNGKKGMSFFKKLFSFFGGAASTGLFHEYFAVIHRKTTKSGKLILLSVILQYLDYAFPFIQLLPDQTQYFRNKSGAVAGVFSGLGGNGGYRRIGFS